MSAKRKTIYDIKREYENANPEGHYFKRSTMKFFNQTLRDFKVSIVDKEREIYYLTAPVAYGKSEQYFWGGKLYTTLERAVAACDSTYKE